MDNISVYNLGDEYVVLDKTTDFTIPALVSYLNEKYGGKKSGKAFTSGDIQQYLRRGYLPKPYGYNPISKVEEDDIGLRLVRVQFGIVKKD